jgi:type I restriction enzyme S subunit
VNAWQTVALGEATTITGGGTPTRNNTDYYGGTIPWVTPKDMKSWEIHGAQVNITEAGLESSAARLIPANSVLIVVRSGVLKHTIPVALNRVPVAINQDMKALRCSDALDPDFLGRFIKAQSSEILQWVRATTADNFPIDMLKQLRVPVPPLAEQRRIADVLDRAEVLRAKRRAALSKLDTLTQSIFLDLFGDPVANPKRWPNPTLGGLLAYQRYGPRFYNEPYSSDGIRIVRITDLDETGSLDFSSMPRLAVSDTDRDKYVLHPGDLIFARSGATVGKVALILPRDPPCIAGAYFITLRFARTIEPLYARAVLKAPSVRAIVTKMSRQAAQQNFSGPALRKLPMPLPPLDLQREFAGRLSAIEKLKSSHTRSLAAVGSLFTSLQHRAFRGEL